MCERDGDGADDKPHVLPSSQTVGSRSTYTARGTCLPAPVSEKKVLKASSPPPIYRQETGETQKTFDEGTKWQLGNNTARRRQGSHAHKIGRTHRLVARHLTVWLNAVFEAVKLQFVVRFEEREGVKYEKFRAVDRRRWQCVQFCFTKHVTSMMMCNRLLCGLPPSTRCPIGCRPGRCGD